MRSASLKWTISIIRCTWTEIPILCRQISHNCGYYSVTVPQNVLQILLQSNYISFYRTNWATGRFDSVVVSGPRPRQWLPIILSTAVTLNVAIIAATAAAAAVSLWRWHRSISESRLTVAASFISLPEPQQLRHSFSGWVGEGVGRLKCHWQCELWARGIWWKQYTYMYVSSYPDIIYVTQPFSHGWCDAHIVLIVGRFYLTFASKNYYHKRQIFQITADTVKIL